MQDLPPVLPVGTRVRVRFGRYQHRTGTVADDHALLPAMEPLVWVTFDGGTERGLIAVRFLDRVR
ncbi:hypothetical protein [Gandjariella thermophila]|uniref:Uncharacterized protein n=1 Tax=Gandjariella thermophila TaxID=1931992 RepID=A0A4D4JI01_9PSEU|nr:hypothetical protein [Gandjariella thermophila]GDY33899.1 hypothetical protein GTS_55320 [Gandjariella thermophila]